MRSGIPHEKALFDADEVAQYLGVERTTVQRWCRSGYLKAIKIGRDWRIRRAALEDLLKRSETTLENPK
jgi:excisionase family DNA binding protein